MLYSINLSPITPENPVTRTNTHVLLCSVMILDVAKFAIR